MKLSRVIVVAVCLTAGIAGVWAAATAPAPTAAPKPEVLPATSPAGEAAPSMTFKNDQEKVSYVIGYQAGSQFRAQDLQLDMAIMVQGLKDGFGGQRPAVPDDQAKQVLTAFQKDVAEKAAKKRQEMAAVNLASSKAFLEANAKKEGVKVLPDGLQYRVITEGTGKTPTKTDLVKVNYKGTLASGVEFDNSYKRGQPAEFGVGQVIKGWTEALEMMKEGSKWELYIPPDLAYGENGRPSIPPNSALIFEVELIEIVKPDAGAAVPVTPGASAVAPAPKPATPAAPATTQKPK
jgi:FKBP-type peptidyl-prolyl cis-trans isomerase FklB